ncbi:trans-sulfuration enzyme family protein [Paenibacillus gansuensis]|uniref:Trans-sulfuration enzyme family protein n=1 Tax=Paenibacillus gansuensis TaxID=306542 RepID=A0ABW5PGH8_9BACL
MTTRTSRSDFTTVSYDPIDTRHHGSIAVPVYQSSLFAHETYAQFEEAFEDLFLTPVYSRGRNPTVAFLEEKLAVLESGEAARCFASGMAAITAAIMSCVNQGDHVLCVSQAYGPTREFFTSYLTRFGIETTYVDGTSMEALRQAVLPNTALLYLESPTTMRFEVQDLSACTELARSIGARTIIDNTWATPIFQKPLAFGVDLVVHSLTKYVSGHSDCVGGAVIGSKELINRLSTSEYMLFGGIMAPQIAALLIRGLRSLPLRMQRHQETGLQVAAHLERQPHVIRVNHPGLPSHPQHELAKRQMSGYGSLFSFVTDEPIARLKAWSDRLHYFKIGVSWGGFESLIVVNEIPDGEAGDRRIVRLYVGLEDPADLIADLDEAWARVRDL